MAADCGERGFDQMLEHRALARLGAVRRLGDAAVEIGQFRGGEARRTGHALAQNQLGMFAQLLDRGGGGLDHVAELGVVADAQAGDAVALRVIQLQRGDHAAGIVAQAPLGVQFAIVAGGDHARRRRCAREADRRARPTGVSRSAGSSASAALARASAAGTGGISDAAARSATATPSRMAARSRGTPRPSASRPSARAISGAPRSAARSSAAAAGLASSHDQASCRSTMSAGSSSGADRKSESSRAPAAVAVRCTAPSSECRVSPVAGANDLQIGARRRVDRHAPGLALRRGASQPRQRAGLGGADVVERRRGGDRLAIREFAKGIERGGGEGLGEPPARDQRRRHGGLGRALGLPLAERQTGGSQDFRRIEPAQECRQSVARNGGGLEQAGGDVEPGGADALLPDALLPGVLLFGRQRQQQIGPRGVEQRLLDDRSRRDQAHHAAADRGFAARGFRVVQLLGDGDAPAAADQPREIGFGAVHRDAAHRDRRARVLAARGERDVERRRGGFRVGEEHLVEIAHAEEQQRVGLLGLQREPLRHGGGGTIGRRDRADAVHERRCSRLRCGCEARRRSQPDDHGTGLAGAGGAILGDERAWLPQGEPLQAIAEGCVWEIPPRPARTVAPPHHPDAAAGQAARHRGRDRAAAARRHRTRARRFERPDGEADAYISTLRERLTGKR